MEYNKIIAVTGLPGLFELLTSKNDGAIVRALEDKTTKFVSSRIHNFSHLETIEVYTTKENVNLVEVFKAMKGSSESLPDIKDNAAIKKYFEKVFPEIDFERVYVSDMKKMVKWFTVLDNNNIEFKLSEAPAEEVAVEQSPAEVVEEKPAEEKKKPARKKAAAVESADAQVATEEAPKKKTTRKKKTEE